MGGPRSSGSTTASGAAPAVTVPAPAQGPVSSAWAASDKSGGLAGARQVEAYFQEAGAPFRRDHTMGGYQTFVRGSFDEVRNLLPNTSAWEEGSFPGRDGQVLGREAYATLPSSRGRTLVQLYQNVNPEGQPVGNVSVRALVEKTRRR